MHFDTSVIAQNLPLLARGLELTLLLVAASLILGTAFGALACVGKLLGRGLLYWIAVGYIALLRGVPELIVMFWIYYCGPLLLGARLSSFAAALAAMSLYAGAYLAEIFRAGVLAVPRGHVEAARALGLAEPFVWLDIILPQALRTMIPAFIGVVTIIVKVSGLASAIGVAELVYEATIVSGQSYRYFELFTAVGACYFALIFPLSLLAQRYEAARARRLR
ncbi:MAG TPA: amino acid ABC transporter permease [Stellaceae bacterium]|nr:amino acid ABC transporter permease [Stellaceae bacterium]